ncbi:MAG: amidohydrolase [Ignavibacteria bacterium]|nr:amidohydrolase [Ignavibacteria bacterium]
MNHILRRRSNQNSIIHFIFIKKILLIICHSNKLKLQTIIFSLLICLNLLAVLSCSSRAYERTGSKPADLVIINAEIFTSNSKMSEAEAMAVKGERISFVGKNDDVTDYIGKNTRIIDADGRRVTPGFVDSHCHVLWVGGMLSLMPANLFGCKNWADMKKTLQQSYKERSHLPFIGGIGWKMEYVPGGIPKKEILDEVIKDKPVILMAYSGQSGWMNSIAVEKCSSANPEAFEEMGPVKDSEGRFTGELLRFVSFNFLDYFTNEEIDEKVQKLYLDAMNEAVQSALVSGVTTLQDAQINKRFIPYLFRFKKLGGLDNVRIRCAYYVPPERLKDKTKLLTDLKEWRKLDDEISDKNLKLGRSIKLYIDGTEDNLTCFMLEPFSNRPGYYGHPVWTQDDFNWISATADKLGIQVMTHAVGDAGIRRVVNGYEYAMTQNNSKDSRHRIEHNNLPHPDEVKRMGKLNIVASMQPTHMYADVMVDSAFGFKRLQNWMPWKSLADNGARVAFGSDWCNSPFNPFYGLIISATRYNYKGDDDWAPEEKISVEDAIRHWTIDAAYALFMENEVGSLEVGKFADFVMFNKDPLEVSSLWFLLTHEVDLGTLDDVVDITVVGGKIVYQKKDAKL